MRRESVLVLIVIVCIARLLAACSGAEDAGARDASLAPDGDIAPAARLADATPDLAAPPLTDAGTDSGTPLVADTNTGIDTRTNPETDTGPGTDGDPSAFPDAATDTDAVAPPDTTVLVDTAVLVDTTPDTAPDADVGPEPPETLCELPPPPLCESDEHCEQLHGPADTCRAWRCDTASGECSIDDLRYIDDEAGRVENNLTRACCTRDADCSWPGEDTERWSCPEVGGVCRYCPCACPDPILAFAATFEEESGADGLSGWTVHDSVPGDAVTVQVVPGSAWEGQRSLYLGDPLCGWTFNGDGAWPDCAPPYPPEEDVAHATRVHLEAVSPEIQLSADAAFVIAFAVRGRGEPPDVASGGESGPAADALVVSIEVPATGVRQTVFDTTTHGNDLADWTWFVADIARFADQSVRVHVEFDTFDAVANRQPGWWIDDIRLRSVCRPVCRSDADCLDGNPCTPDRCAAFEGDPDGRGLCQPSPSCDPACWVDADCDTGDDCVEGTCGPERVCAARRVPTPECCREETLLDETFEGLDGWLTAGDGVASEPDEDAEDGPCLLLREDGTATGVTAWALAASPSVTLPAQDSALPAEFERPIAVFHVKLLSAADGASPDASPRPPSGDVLRLHVRTSEPGLQPEDTPVWTSGGLPRDAWASAQVDLAPWQGRTFRLVWRYEADATDAVSGGALIDSVLVRTECVGDLGGLER